MKTRYPPKPQVGGRRRRRPPEDHENHEAWAIPYGDLVTLLLAFFVVMYAMSSVNAGKYRILSDSLAEAFHGTPHSEQTQERVAQHVEQPTAAGTEPDNPGAEAKAALAGAEADAKELDSVADDVNAAMSSLVEAGQVHVHRHDNWVTVDISSDILFSSGAAKVSTVAENILGRLADTLQRFPNQIRVTGHTDDRPISTPTFPSNWELSSARAATVVHLFMDRGVAPERLSVMGFGQYQPVMPNTSETGRNANRRVEVMIMSQKAAAAP